MIKKEQLFELAELQRDIPENAMLKAAIFLEGGVMPWALEHTGDLIHRMSEEMTFKSAGYSFVKNKVEKVLSGLKGPYGFMKEFFENIKSSSEYRKLNYDAFMAESLYLMGKYSQAHEDLPAYNEAHRLARKAAASLGRLDINTTIKCLEKILSQMGTVEEWVSFAHQGVEGDYDEE